MKELDENFRTHLAIDTNPPISYPLKTTYPIKIKIKPKTNSNWAHRKQISKEKKYTYHFICSVKKPQKPNQLK